MKVTNRRVVIMNEILRAAVWMVWRQEQQQSKMNSDEGLMLPAIVVTPNCDSIITGARPDNEQHEALPDRICEDCRLVREKASSLVLITVS